MRSLFCFFLSLNCIASIAVFSQAPSATWPFTNVARPTCTTMTPGSTTCTKWPVKDGRWDESSTWNDGTIPGHQDIVCIPAGRTVIVKNPTYTATTSCPNTNTSASPQCFLFVCGILDFDASGKLHLGCNSSIQVLAGGSVSPSNGNSDLIQIGTNVVWRDNNTTLTGPTCVCDGCPPNNVGCTYNAPTPVKLISFSAKQESHQGISLFWSSTQEINFKNYIVEKSSNGVNWQNAGEIFPKVSDNSNAISNYSFRDGKPFNGINYYRLKQADNDGHFDYSNVVQINFKPILSEYSVFPNPAKDKITIYSKAGFTQGSQVQLYHKNGVMLETRNIQSANAQTMDVSNLSNGVYFLRIVDAKGTTLHTQSVIKN